METDQIDKPVDVAHIKLMNDTIRIASFKIDTVVSTATLYFGNDTLNKSILHYHLDLPYLRLRDVSRADTIAMWLKRCDERNFLVVNQKLR